MTIKSLISTIFGGKHSRKRNMAAREAKHYRRAYLRFGKRLNEALPHLEPTTRVDSNNQIRVILWNKYGV